MNAHLLDTALSLQLVEERNGFEKVSLCWALVLVAFFHSFYKFLKNWSIADLQCCVNFCCTVKRLSYTFFFTFFSIMIYHKTLYDSLCYTVWVCVLAAQSSPTLCDPIDSSLPGSSVHGILQARILGCVAIPFSRGSSRPWGWTLVFCIADRFFTIWAIREAQYRSAIQ